MKTEKTQEVINKYREKFEELGVKKNSYSHTDKLDSTKHCFEHCHAMLDSIDEFIEENRTDKAFRWLGFIQGALWAQKIYTIDELKTHNRTIT